MNNFAPLPELFELLIATCVQDRSTHAKWLNTLSYLENCGARKIARSEHRWDVSKEVLKHAAEEFRHAFYLKQQIATRLMQLLPDYRIQNVLGGWLTIHYLDTLELQICRQVKHFHPAISADDLKTHAYLLTTFTIELRASEVYPIYQRILSNTGSSVSVRSILLEEKGHLEEMQTQLAHFNISKKLIAQCCTIEGQLCRSWLKNPSFWEKEIEEVFF